MLYIHKCTQYVCACVCVCGGCFPQSFSHLFFLKQGLLLNLELTDPARLAGEEPTELWGWCVVFYAMLADLHSSPNTCRADTLLDGTSPQTLLSLLVLTTMDFSLRSSLISHYFFWLFRYFRYFVRFLCILYLNVVIDGILKFQFLIMLLYIKI